MIYKGEEGYYWKVLTPNMATNPKKTNKVPKQQLGRRLSNTENELRSPQTCYSDDSLHNPEEAQSSRKLVLSDSSHTGSFLKNHSDGPLFNKSQKRISRLTNYDDSLPCNNGKSDVLDRIFDCLDKPVSIGEEKSVKSIKCNNPPLLKKPSAKINPWTSGKKSSNFTKIKADSLNIKRNINGVRGQRAHMNVPVPIEKPKKAKNAAVPSTSKASVVTSNAIPGKKKEFVLKDYKIPKKIVENRKSNESTEKLQYNKQISQQTVRPSEFSRLETQNRNKSEFNKQQPQSRDRSEFRRQQLQNCDKTFESSRRRLLSYNNTFKSNRQVSQKCDKISESNRHVREFNRQMSDESIGSSESSKNRSESESSKNRSEEKTQKSNNSGSGKDIKTCKFDRRRSEDQKIISKSSKQNFTSNEKGKSKKKEFSKEKQLQEKETNEVNSPIQNNFVKGKNGTETNKDDKASSSVSSISPPESPLPQLELPKAAERKQPFKRICIQDDEEEEDDDDFNIQPPSKKVRPLDSDSEESEAEETSMTEESLKTQERLKKTEEILLPPLSSASEINMLNSATEVVEGTAHSMEQDTDKTVNLNDTVNNFDDDVTVNNFDDDDTVNNFDDDDTVNNFDDDDFDNAVNFEDGDFDNAVNFEDGENFNNDCGIRIENVESGVHLEETPQMVPEYSSGIAANQAYDTSNSSNFPENSMFTRSEACCEREDSNTIHNDSDDDIEVIYESVNRPMNRLLTENTTHNIGNQLISELPIHSSTYNIGNQLISELPIHSSTYNIGNQLISELPIRSNTYNSGNQLISELPIQSSTYNSGNQPVSESSTYSSTYRNDNQSNSGFSAHNSIYNNGRSVEKLFRKPKAITKTNEIAKMLTECLTSNNPEHLQKELLKKISSQSLPVCCLCKSSTSLMTCLRCDEPVCRNFCNNRHPCSGQ